MLYRLLFLSLLIMPVQLSVAVSAVSNGYENKATQNTHNQNKSTYSKKTFNANSKLTLGNKKASLALIEFSDYQCAYCKRFAQNTFPGLKKKYIDTGKLLFIAKDFPLRSHVQATGAATAARCAAEQGRYEDMRNALFNGARYLSPTYYATSANKLGLEQNTFEACMANRAIAMQINQDYQEGRRQGVTGTPRFFIGRLEGDKVVDVISITGSKPLAAFERAINNAALH